jgi:hypothetical protein
LKWASHIKATERIPTDLKFELAGQFFFKYTPVLNFTKIYPVGVVLLHEDGRVERGRNRQTDMTKLIVYRFLQFCECASEAQGNA